MRKLTPNFVEWAKTIVDREDVAIALEQAFNLGQDTGYLIGYDDGAEKGWQKIWNADTGFTNE